MDVDIVISKIITEKENKREDEFNADFGMMDNPRYVKNTGEKLQLYMTHEIIPSINLITTYETIKKPLSYKDVEKIVEEYFL